jgi:UDP-N-acetylmuramoylalanine--D-glutamate ligase
LQKNVKSTIRDKKVTVVGLARSGVGAANMLSRLGADVTVTDIKRKEELKDFISRLNKSVKLVLAEHPEHIFTKADLLVISPGIQLNIPQIINARSKGVPVIGELELAYQIIRGFERGGTEQEKEINGQIKFLAVTGTNGKSTTTALLAFIMKRSHFDTIVGGNIGNALTDEMYKRIQVPENRRNGTVDISNMSVDYVVTEVSSFQLESIHEFRPHVATILNITPDHLDRYHSIEEYISAKARICENQKANNFLVLNRDDPATMNLYDKKFRGRNNYLPNIYFFSRREVVEGVYCKDGTVYHNFSDGQRDYSPNPLIRASEIKIRGIHNLENAMAASAMALLANCPVEAVRDSLKGFPGLEHRLEFVRELRGVQYFNDSKGTNIGAVVKSLESFKEPIILIAGGRDKAGEFSLLRPIVKERVKALVLIGEARKKIHDALGDLTRTVDANDLREAVNLSQRLAVQDDIVVLSPACASFDMFVDFEDRGRQFKSFVKELK